MHIHVLKTFIMICFISGKPMISILFYSSVVLNFMKFVKYTHPNPGENTSIIRNFVNECVKIDNLTPRKFDYFCNQA